MNLQDWLSRSIATNQPAYRHQDIREVGANRAFGLNVLKERVALAHADVRRHVAELLAVPLDPRGRKDPLPNYPGNLSDRTLKGYLGEVFAGIIAEDFSPFGVGDWHVPAYLFRFHHHALDKLLSLEPAEVGDIPGRPGDDCLAFVRDGSGRISMVLVCEAKCTGDHDAHLISEGHEQLSEDWSLADILHLVEILGDYQDIESQSWRASLQMLALADSGQYERRNMLSYVCGRTSHAGAPWIDPNAPHHLYASPLMLEAVEVHISNVAEVIDEVYRRP